MGIFFLHFRYIGNYKLTLDVIDINGLSKDYSILMDSLFERVENMGVKVGTVYMDREFFNKKVISKMVSSSNLMGFQSQEKYNSYSIIPYHILE